MPQTSFPPSYRNGYTLNPYESENPQAWEDALAVYAPGLGDTGSTLRDLCGRGMHGTLSGATPPAHMVYRGKPCLDFDGSTSYVALGNRLALFNDMTVAMSFNPDTGNTGDRFMISCSQSNLLGCWGLYTPAGFFGNHTLAMWWAGIFRIYAGTYSPGTWYRCVFLRRRLSATPGDFSGEVWLNGKLVAQTYNGPADPNGSATSACEIGRRAGAADQYFDGKVGESLIISSRAWRHSEIQADYQDPMAMFRRREVGFKSGRRRRINVA